MFIKKITKTKLFRFRMNLLNIVRTCKVERLALFQANITCADPGTDKKNSINGLDFFSGISPGPFLDDSSSLH